MPSTIRKPDWDRQSSILRRDPVQRFSGGPQVKFQEPSLDISRILGSGSNSTRLDSLPISGSWPKPGALGSSERRNPVSPRPFEVSAFEVGPTNYENNKTGTNLERGRQSYENRTSSVDRTRLNQTNLSRHSSLRDVVPPTDRTMSLDREYDPLNLIVSSRDLKRMIRVDEIERFEKEWFLSSSIVDFFATWAIEQSNLIKKDRKAKPFRTGFIQSLLENPVVVTRQTLNFINQMNKSGGYFFYYFFYENLPGEWALFEYDAVKDRFTYFFNNRKSMVLEETVIRFNRVTQALKHLFNEINQSQKNYSFREERDIPSCEDPQEAGLYSLEFFRRRIFGQDISRDMVGPRELQNIKKTLKEILKTVSSRPSVNNSRDYSMADIKAGSTRQSVSFFSG